MIRSENLFQAKMIPWKISPTERSPRTSANLNGRQERFVLEYLKRGNGTKAAIAAGYAHSSAAVHAHRLLKNERVLEKIRASKRRVLRRAEITDAKTLKAIAEVAYFDPGCLFDQNGDLLPLNEMPKDALRAIDFLEVGESVRGGRRVRTLKMVKFADKLPALELLANYLGMFPAPRKRSR
jgi:Terminase small subunit